MYNAFLRTVFFFYLNEQPPSFFRTVNWPSLSKISDMFILIFFVWADKCNWYVMILRLLISFMEASRRNRRYIWQVLAGSPCYLSSVYMNMYVHMSSVHIRNFAWHKASNSALAASSVKHQVNFLRFRGIDLNKLEFVRKSES